MRILLVDNYDSFTWNLAHYLEELGARVEVVLNDQADVEQLRARGFDAWVISPGPGRPEHAGISLDLVRAAVGHTPLLGVCLGHQALAQAHGARVVQAPVLMHGKTSAIQHDGQGLFQGLARPLVATRYHSLVVEPESLPADFEISARTADGVVMGIRHREWPMFGIQFHPESVLTVEGKPLLANFLELAARGCRESMDAA
ncbi:MAG: anthranilate synthase component II [Planctomycetota bacterium]|jgi:anthranilate synthase/aminodeoxychorismate synthase-like glutamine amidotransferase